MDIIPGANSPAPATTEPRDITVSLGCAVIDCGPDAGRLVHKSLGNLTRAEADWIVDFVIRMEMKATPRAREWPDA